MGSRVDRRTARLTRETERLLKESCSEIRQLDLPVDVARRNIRNFLDHLSQFDDQEKRPERQCPERP